MDRRKFLVAGGGAIFAAACETQPIQVATPAGALMPSNACKPTIITTPGPYVLPNSQLRANITEGRAGVPMMLRMQVVDLYTCTPRPGAKVELWHSDADGIYSGFENIIFDIKSLKPSLEGAVDTRGATFLRGHQVSDARGYVTFSTIFPGWYGGRLPHVHVRTFDETPAGVRTHDTQLFFPAEVQNQVYLTDAYKARGPNTIGLDRDLVLRGDKHALKELTVPLRWNGNALEGDMALAAFLYLSM